MLPFPDADAVFVFTAAPPSRREVAAGIVRATLAAHEGWEAKDEDGAFFLVFSRPSDALAWAGAAALALDASGLAIGIGIHSGPAVRRTDPASGRPDWFGPPVNRAARLAQAAHPGQVLAGEAVAAARGEGLVARWLGAHRLRGLATAEDVWQVLPAALDQEFPPPATGEARALPPAPGVLYGRDDVLDTIAEAWRAGARLVVVVGPGGVGKSAVAVHAARRAADRWPVWACIVEGLSAAATGAQAARAVEAGPAGEVGAAVAGRGPGLLLLDGLGEESVGRVARWLQEAPDLRILATARQRLGVSSEHVVPVEPLPVPRDADRVAGNAAAALLRERLGPAGARWDDAGVAAILDRAGGLPLAVEVVAARLARLPPGEEVRLDDVIGARSPVLEVVERALDDLSADEQAVFAQCATFAGGFDVDAAEAVLEVSDGWPLDALESLVGKALVRATPSTADGSPRFDLLPSMRALAESRLSGEARDAAQRRHTAWYARLADALDTSTAHYRHAVEVENFGRALGQALAAGDDDLAGRLALRVLLLGETVGPIWLGVTEAEALLARGALSPDLRARVQIRLAALLRLTGRTEQAERLLREAMRHDEPTIALAARVVLGNVLPRERRMDLNRETLRMATAHRALRLLGGVRLRHGLDLEAIGDLDGAEEAFRSAIAELATHDDPVQEARVWGSLASLLQRRGQWAEAIASYERALRMFGASAVRRDEAIARSNFANLLVESGFPERALPLYEAAAAMHREAGSLRSIAFVLGNQGLALHLLGRSARGAALLEEALRLHETHGSEEAAEWVRGALAEMATDRGLDEDAERWLVGIEGATVARARATLAARRDEMDEAMRWFDAATAVFQQEGSRPELAWTWLREAEVGTPRAADRSAAAARLGAELGWPETSPFARRIAALAGPRAAS